MERAYFYAWALMVILIIAAAAPVMAASVLLVELPGGGGTGGSPLSYTGITAVSLGLVYGFPSTNPFPYESCVGCELLIAPGQMGVFTLNASTSPDWADVVGRLTDNIDELLSRLMFVHHSALPFP